MDDEVVVLVLPVTVGVDVAAVADGSLCWFEWTRDLYNMVSMDGWKAALWIGFCLAKD